MAGDELHIVARLEVLDEVQQLAGRWRDGPLGEPPVAALPPRGASQVFTVRPWADADGDPERARGRSPASPSPAACARAATAPARWSCSPTAATRRPSAELLAVGGRRRLAEWCARRVGREGLTPAERAWWQELAGALSAPAPPRGAPDPR